MDDYHRYAWACVDHKKELEGMMVYFRVLPKLGYAN